MPMTQEADLPGKRVLVLRPDELSPNDQKMWREIRTESGAPANPFLDPAFTTAVGRVRPGARVAVLQDDGSPVGFFPYERGPLGQGRAIGLGVSDSQGAVLRPGIRLDARRLLRSCALSSWEFDNLEAGQGLFVPHAAEELASPVVDLAEGFERYTRRLRAKSPSFLRQTLAKERRLARQVGEVRFVYDADDPAALRALMGWKSAQYRRTGRRDRFAQDWITRLVGLLGRSEEPGVPRGAVRAVRRGPARGGALRSAFAHGALLVVPGLRPRVRQVLPRARAPAEDAGGRGGRRGRDGRPRERPGPLQGVAEDP